MLVPIRIAVFQPRKGASFVVELLSLIIATFRRNNREEFRRECKKATGEYRRATNLPRDELEWNAWRSHSYIRGILIKSLSVRGTGSAMKFPGEQTVREARIDPVAYKAIGKAAPASRRYFRSARR